MSEINDILDKVQSGEISAEDAVEMIENRKKNNKKKSKMDVLKDIESGKISASDAVDLISSDEQADDFAEESTPLDFPTPEDISRYERWWRIPWIVGLVIFIGSGMGMNSIAQVHGFNFWFFLLILPLFIGFVILLLTWPSDKKPWVHVRVKSRGNSQNVKISIPLPIVFTSWAFKFSRNFMPLEVSEKINADAIELIFKEISEGKRSGNPFHVHVDEGGDEIVDVYIG